MAVIGNVIVYIIMACMVAGAAASILKPESELGGQFVEGIHSIGPIFLSVAGIFAAIPYLSVFIQTILGPLFRSVGADAAMAATTLVAVDMGGYQLADVLAETRESWIMAMYTGYMAGATIVFTIPVGLKIIQKQDERYFALGIMSGMLSIPVGVLISSAITAISEPMIRASISSSAEAAYQIALSYRTIFQNLLPLIIICVLIALGLWLIPDQMIKGFAVFGKFIDIAAKIVLVVCILEHFTGVFSLVFHHWGFDPIIADSENQERALEIVGNVCMMLAGAFPMVYLIQRYLNKSLSKIGRAFHLSESATAGILACSANAIAMFPMIKDMEAEDKVKVIAFSVCGAFLIGDHLSFMANFQPSLIVPLFAAKILAGATAVAIAGFIAIPKIKSLK